MVKKFVLGALLLGLCGVLVAGALNRTTAKTTQSEPVYGQGENRGRTETTSDAEKQLRGSLESGGNNLRSITQDSDRNPISESEQAYGQADNRGRTEITSDAEKQLRGSLESVGNNRRSTTQDSDYNPISDPIFAPEWAVLQGTVADVDEDALTVTLLGGEQIVVEERAWSFAQEQGFAPQVGDQVTLNGFFHGEEFEVGRIENLTTGQLVTLRDPGGRPQWAGRGRRSG